MAGTSIAAITSINSRVRRLIGAFRAQISDVVAIRVTFGIYLRGSHIRILMLEYPLGRPESTREQPQGNRGFHCRRSLRKDLPVVNRSFNQVVDYTGQPAFVAIETGDHRRQHFVRIQFLDLERVARMVGQQGEEGELRPAVSFAEGMDRI